MGGGAEVGGVSRPHPIRKIWGEGNVLLIFLSLPSIRLSMTSCLLSLVPWRACASPPSLQVQQKYQTSQNKAILTQANNAAFFSAKIRGIKTAYGAYLGPFVSAQKVAFFLSCKSRLN